MRAGGDVEQSRSEWHIKRDGRESGVMRKMKLERERQTIIKTNKMGKYKLRVTREKKHRQKSREGR